MERPDPASQTSGRIPADRAGPPQDAAQGRGADGFQRQLEQASAAEARDARLAGTIRMPQPGRNPQQGRRRPSPAWRPKIGWKGTRQ